jgi:hypothetical protein
VVVGVGWLDKTLPPNPKRKVDILDVAIVAIAYKSKPGDPKWNAIADLDKNSIIDILDITKVAVDYGKTV